MSTYKTPMRRDAVIGMSDSDARRFSWLRVIRALANPGDRRLQDDAAFEMDACKAAEQAAGVTARGLMVPHDVLVGSQRDLVVGTATGGGYLKGTTHAGGAFIDLLRAKSMCVQMGATQITGNVGDVAIPKRTAGATAYWLANEGTAITEGANTFSQVSLSPKISGAYVDVSYKLLKQASPDAESLVTADLAESLASAFDKAALHGSGADGEPTGLENVSGIGSVETGGSAVSNQTLLQLERDVAVANADVGTMGYLTNAKVRAGLKQTYTNATYGEVPLWSSGADGMGEVNGYKAGCTGQVADDLGGGSNYSAMFFGNWADLILATWGGLDLIVDPYSLGNYGITRVVGLQAVDVAVRNAESFSAILDATTA
jgi:HK97 family phage major capsid protein